MARAIQTLALLTIGLLISSFTNNDANQVIGTYSVTASDRSQIKLIINADRTFYYQDFSNSNNKIVADGNWTLRGNKVVLENNGVDFHTIWAFENNGAVAKSRKGFTFYKLCKID